MPTNTWNHTLRLADVFHNEDLTFEQRRDRIVRRILDSRFYTEDDDYLYEIVQDLMYATSTYWFDRAWNDFYDWANVHRVWVQTS